MPAEDPYEDDADDVGPPDPMDRLWRHPSEMGSASVSPTSPVVSTVPSPRSAGWISLLGASACGALLTVIVLAAFGMLGADSTREGAAQPAFDSDDGPSTRAAVDEIMPSLARITAATAYGPVVITAVCVGHDALVTSAHALGGATEVTVVRSDGRPSTARVLGVDPVTDLAVIDTSDNPSSVGMTAGDPEVGDDVIAVGAPADGSPWVTTGVVASVDTVAERLSDRVLSGLIEVDTDVATRAVGGPIIDREGKVVGVIIGSADGRARAVPVSTVRRVVEAIQTDGYVEHAWLGVTADDADGARIEAVDPTSPAAAAHLAPGDVIIKYDGRRISSVAALAAETLRRNPGDDVMLTVRNGDDTRSVTVVLGPRPQPTSPPGTDTGETAITADAVETVGAATSGALEPTAEPAAVDLAIGADR